jgi:hypothetical protein
MFRRYSKLNGNQIDQQLKATISSCLALDLHVPAHCLIFARGALPLTPELIAMNVVLAKQRMDEPWMKPKTRID